MLLFLSISQNSFTVDQYIFYPMIGHNPRIKPRWETTQCCPSQYEALCSAQYKIGSSRTQYHSSVQAGKEAIDLQLQLLLLSCYIPLHPFTVIHVVLHASKHPQIHHVALWNPYCSISNDIIIKPGNQKTTQTNILQVGCRASPGSTPLQSKSGIFVVTFVYIIVHLLYSPVVFLIKEYVNLKMIPITAP